MSEIDAVSFDTGRVRQLQRFHDLMPFRVHNILLVSSLYDPDTEAGIRWDDPEVGVAWGIDEPLLSARDQEAPLLSEASDLLTL